MRGCFLFFDAIIAFCIFVSLVSCGHVVSGLVLGAIFALPNWIWLCIRSDENQEKARLEQSALTAEIERKRELEEKRKNTVCSFSDGISEEEFSQIAAKSAKSIRRLSIFVSGPKVYGTVLSASGISTWTFSLDFNDFGHITGKSWLIDCENYDSSIPDAFRANMENEIKARVLQ